MLSLVPSTIFVARSLECRDSFAGLGTGGVHHTATFGVDATELCQMSAGDDAGYPGAHRRQGRLALLGPSGLRPMTPAPRRETVALIAGRRESARWRRARREPAVLSRQHQDCRQGESLGLTVDAGQVRLPAEFTRAFGRLDVQQFVAEKFRQRCGWQTVRNTWVLL